MTWRQDMVARLNEAPALFGGRIYPMGLPQQVEMPAAAYGSEQSQPSRTLQGAVDFATAVVQIACYADDYGSAVNHGGEVRKRLDAYAAGPAGNQTVFGWLAEVDGYDETAELYISTQIFTVGYGL